MDHSSAPPLGLPTGSPPIVPKAGPSVLPPQAVVPPVVAKATSPVIETVAAEKAPSLDFEVSAAFKLSNIKSYFEDEPAAPPPRAQHTPFFGPQLRLDIDRGTSPKKGIAVYLDLSDSNTLLRPMHIRFFLKFSADSKARDVYRTLSFSHTISDDGDQWGWDEALSANIWETEEPLRRADAVYILVKVVGSLSQTPTPRAPPVLNLLHETIVDAPRSVIRFTVYDRQDLLSKKLTNGRTLLANRDIMKDTCAILHDIIMEKTQWKGLLKVDAPESAPGRVADSEISEGDSDLEDAEDGSEATTQTECSSLSGVSLDEPDELLSHGLHLGEDTEHAGGDDSHNASAEQDSQDGSESPVVEIGKSGGSDRNSDDWQMEIDAVDTPVTKAQATQTDPPQPSSDSRTLDVVVVGAAATTWEAFIFYLYTGIIKFAPLSSRGRTERNAYMTDFKPDKRPKPCSPKSIYRIAHRMEQEPLKQLALKKIVEELRVDNILPELFSAFTSKYKEVEKQELQFFTQHCVEIMDSQAFKTLMVDVATGTYPHAGTLLGKVFQKVKEALTAKAEGPKTG